MLGGLAIHPRVANFPQCLCVKNYENWLAVDKVIAKIIRLTFFGPPCRPNEHTTHASTGVSRRRIQPCSLYPY